MSKSEMDVLTSRKSTQTAREFHLGEFKVNLGPEFRLPEAIKVAFEDFLNTRFIDSHRRTSQPHKTIFQANTGLPSPIVRIDASSIVDPMKPQDSMFEVEARPAGLGILTEMFGVVEPIRRVFERVSALTNMPIAFAALPSVTGAISGRDRSIDTQLLAKHMNLPYLYRVW